MRIPSRRLAFPLGFASLLSLGLVFGAPPNQPPIELPNQPLNQPLNQDGQEVQIEVRPVAGTFSVLFGRGGNIGLCIGEEGVLMVDCQFAPLSARIRAKIDELAGIQPTWVLNTHWHRDHTGGNEAFGETGTIVAHRNVRQRLAGDETLGGRVRKDTPAGALPEITYDGGIVLHFNGETIRLMHFPNAHTDGDTVVWFQGSNVVHTGDVFFQVGYPFIDVDSGGNALGMLEAVNALLDLIPEDARIVAGHGVPTDVADLTAYRDMLETVIDRVRELVAEGKSREQVVAAKPSAEFDERWGGFDFVGPDDFVGAVFASLAGE